MNKTNLLLLTSLLGFGSGIQAEVSITDTDIMIYPMVSYFGSTTIGQTTSAIEVTVSNDKAESLPLGSADLTGVDASQFEISSDLCSDQTLEPDTSCKLSVVYKPTQFGSKMATLEIPTLENEPRVLTAFFSNDEDDETQAERRLPPVMYKVNLPDNLTEDTTHTFTWSILGYHGNYTSKIAIFDCSIDYAGECGSNYAEQLVAVSGDLSPDAIVDQNTWLFMGNPAQEMQYSYTLTLDQAATLDLAGQGEKNFVIRFYRRNDMDTVAGEANLSLLLPGGLLGDVVDGPVYNDSEGRLIGIKLK